MKEKGQTFSQRILWISILLYLTICLGTLIFSPSQVQTNIYQFANDFLSYYVGAKLFWSGINPYDLVSFISSKDNLHLNFLHGQGYVYPPLLLIILYPFSILPPLSSIQIWYIVNVAVYAVIGFLLFRKLEIKNKLHLALLLFIYFTFPPMLGNLSVGQINILTLALYFFYLQSITKNDNRAGLIIGIAAALKIYPSLQIINQMIQRKWQTLVFFIIVSGSLFIIPFFFNSFSSLSYYLSQTLVNLQTQADPYWTNQSINSFFSRFILPSDYSTPISSLSVSAISKLASIFNLGIIMLTILISWIYRKNKAKQLLIELLWLGVITIAVGKSNFWTFVPTVLITLFFLINWTNLGKWQKAIFLLSLSLFYYQGILGYTLTSSNPPYFGIWGIILLSGGFLGLLLQISLLVILILKSKNSLTFETYFR